MNARTVAKFPVKRVGALNTHPELSHLKVLSSMALNCGNGATLVEVGPTNGVVTYCLAQTLIAHPDSNLVVVGQIPLEAEEHLSELGVTDRIVCVDQLDEISGRLDLVFVADPAQAQAAELAESRGARVVVIYDVRTAERYRLTQFAALAEAASRLKENTGRVWNELSTAVSFEQARRGMLISEIRSWHPPKPANPKRAEVVLPPPAVPVKLEVKPLEISLNVIAPPASEVVKSVEPEVKAPDAPAEIQKPEPEGPTANPTKTGRKKATFKKRSKGQGN